MLGLIILLITLAVARPEVGFLAGTSADQHIQQFGKDIPVSLRLDYISGSFRLAPNQRFLCEMSHAIQSDDRGGSISTLISREKVIFRFGGIIVDITWPVANVELREAVYHFRTGKVDLYTRKTQSLAFNAGEGKVRKTVEKMVKDVFKGTAFASRKYDPFKDRNLLKNLAALEKNLVFPKAGRCLGLTRVEKVTTRNMYSPRFVAKFTAVNHYETDRIVLEKGSIVKFDLSLRGSIQDLLKRDIKLMTMRVSAKPASGKKDALSVKMAGGKFAEVRSAQISCGLRVSVDYSSGADILQLGILLLGARTGHDTSAVTRDGAVGQKLVDEKAETAVKDWVKANRKIIPGIDLWTALSQCRQ